MSAYDHYKQVNAGWITKIPFHWEATPVKYVCTFNDEVLSETSDPEALIDYVEISDVDESRGLKSSELMQYKEAPSRARRIVRDGDVIISTVRTYLRAVAPITSPPENLIVSTGFAVIRPERLTSGFARYALVAEGFVGSVIARSTGVSYPAINASDLVRIPVPVPPVDEQIAIAAYLDAETKRIDGLIKEKTKLLSLLAELRSTTITDSVTKGLNPKAILKDSGDPWLGKVPKHWDVVTFQRCVYVAEGQVDPREEPYKSMLLIAPNHIESGTGRILYTETAGEQFAESGKYLSHSGDVIYSKIRPALRKVCIAPEDCICSADMYPLRGAEKLTNNFLMWFMLSEPFSALAVLESERVAMPKINRDSLKKVWIALPPINEQLAIHAYIEGETHQIDALISHVEAELEVLKELRSSTITDAVLGRIDVRKSQTH